MAERSSVVRILRPFVDGDWRGRDKSLYAEIRQQAHELDHADMYSDLLYEIKIDGARGSKKKCGIMAFEDTHDFEAVCWMYYFLSHDIGLSIGAHHRFGGRKHGLRKPPAEGALGAITIVKPFRIIEEPQLDHAKELRLTGLYSDVLYEIQNEEGKRMHGIITFERGNGRRGSDCFGDLLYFLDASYVGELHS